MYRLFIKQYRSVFVILATFIFSMNVNIAYAGTTSNNIDASNLHPDRDAIPASDFDLQQLKSLAEQIKAAADDCGKGFKCPVMDCAAANMLRQILLEAKLHLQDMKGWSAKASNEFLAHRNSLVEQSIITDTNRSNAIWAQGVNKFLHDFGSMLLDIAALAGTIEDLAKDGLDPSKVKNLDKLYETLKTYESLVDTVADNLDPSTSTKGTGPLTDLTKDADGMLGLENTSIGSVKSDLSDTISAIENFKGGKPWKGGRDVGQIVGRILKDLSQAEMDERAARIAELARDLRAEEDVTTAAHNDYIRAAERRNLVEDTSTALDAAYNAVIACIRKHCPLSSVAPPARASFSGWGSALRHYNALIPRIRTSLQGAIGGLTFKEREDCADPSVRLSDDPFAGVKDLPIETSVQTGGAPGSGINVNCTGGGCPSEPITGTCFGDSCGESFDLYCPGTGCTEDVFISCTGDSCASEGIVECDAGTCDDTGGFSCGDSGCDAVPTHSVLGDLGYDKTNISNLTFNTNIFPRQNTTVVQRIQTCELCQSIADQIYVLDERLNELENGQYLWESVQDKPAEQEKLHKEQREKEAERKKLAAKLELCQKKCPKEEYFIEPPKSIEINCVGSGCTEGITGTCVGSSCGESFDLTCSGTGCVEDVFISCTGGSCASEGSIECDAGSCDDTGGFSCGDSGCNAVSTHSVLDDIDGPGQTGLIVGESTRGKIGTNCTACKGIAAQLNQKLTRLTELAKDRAKLVQRVKQIKNGAPYTEDEKESISHFSNAKKTETADDDFGAAAGVMAGDFTKDPVLFSYLVFISSIDNSIRDLEKEVNRLFTALIKCEKQCAIVKLIDVISLVGNNPFNRDNPTSEEENNGSTATVSVIFCAGCGGGVNIKVSQSRIKIAGIDACASNHYHENGGPAIGCDGNTYADPAPLVCGYGEVSNTKTIAASECTNP